jgi:hypothetical protein
MIKILPKNFVIACDMDDVLLVPHTAIELSKYLGIYDHFSVPLIEYKTGKRSFESLLNDWFTIMTPLSSINKQSAILHVSCGISENTYQFAEKSKKLGRFIIVSNNDGDLVKSIAGKLKVEYIAVNKYIFEFCFVTQRKSDAIENQKIIIDAAVTDDQVNEKDFLDLPGKKNNTSCGIVFNRNDVITGPDIPYKIVNTLDEVYNTLAAIKNEFR